MQQNNQEIEMYKWTQIRKIGKYGYQIIIGICISLSCTVAEKNENLPIESSIFNFLDIKVPQVATEKIPTSLKNRLKNDSKDNYGIDISYYQGSIMEKLPAHSDSIQFAICKATQGTQYVDPMFKTNWREIQQKGLLRGAYHFYDCSQDPKAQAQHFYTVIKDIKPYDIAPILDIEQGGLVKGQTALELQKQIKNFLEELEKLSGRKPIIYSDYAFIQEYITDAKFSKYDLWLAEYSGHQAPLIPNVWKQKGYLIWQRSDNYHAFSTQIDLDISAVPLKNMVDLNE
ncbi:glycoside hydrolase family 25 protein [Reichenbachiella versicolor]|uniref:glycoside hydrolase family 25 protein n=1 Tax=Reichenbachiella versicolor TaxID=1821036 RepID=UPI000D6DEABA|nr:GH25 family lysozyme [Reichenbachiella versicolor]